MLPEIDAWMRWASMTLTIAGIIRWLAGDHGAQDDAEIAEAHELVVNALSDADGCRTIQCLTDKDLRSQISIEELQRIHEELQLRKFGSGRN